MKAITASIAFILLFSLVFAQCIDDGKCTSEELDAGDCIDCRTNVQTKSYCIDDGICTALEKDLACNDCEEGSSSLNITGFSVFALGTGIFAIAVLVILAFFGGRFLLENYKRQASRKGRL
ncbi:hypothetical protein K8R43_05645 [archaeon]|nr:hypothetical protein [archaeon]